MKIMYRDYPVMQTQVGIYPSAMHWANRIKVLTNSLIATPLCIMQAVLALETKATFASEYIGKIEVPRCSAVANMIKSNHISLSKGLAIKCNPVSEYCEIRPKECGTPPPIMVYKRYCSRTSDVPCSY